MRSQTTLFHPLISMPICTQGFNKKSGYARVQYIAMYFIGKGTVFLVSLEYT